MPHMTPDNYHLLISSPVVSSSLSQTNLNYVHLASFVIIYYDYFVTFRDEVNYIWKHPKSVSSIGFLINRYFSIFANLFLLVATLILEISKPTNNLNAHKHLQLQACREAIVLISEMIVTVLSVIRIYALYRRSRFIIGGVFALMLALGFTVLVFTCLPLIMFFRELESAGPSPLESVSFQAASWEALALFDTIIFLILTIGIKAEHGLAGGEKQLSADQLPIITLMWRDGAIYFGIMAIFNVANIISYYITSQEFYPGSLSTLVNAISVTLMSRLMLNLYTASAEMRRLDPTPDATSPDPRKLIPSNATFLGSNANADVWDSRFTITQNSDVHSFDVFGSSQLSRSFLPEANQGLDIVEEERSPGNRQGHSSSLALSS